jgi:hydroxymethylbilane synthase
MKPMSDFVVGTRGSKLALAQTNLVVEQLKQINSEINIQVEIIKTEGDILSEKSLPLIGGKGIFIKEIEQALRNGKIDFAVHSMKDMPTELPQGLIFAAIPKREDPRDVMISRYGMGLEDLPTKTRIGTGSPRRASQLRDFRNDLEILDIRGNIDTRLRKLDEGNYDVIILAAAGLNRLGLSEKVTDFISCDIMLPSVGQGALAIEMRNEKSTLRDLISQLDHSETRCEVEAERIFLNSLGGGCHTPIASLGRVRDGKLSLRGLVSDPGGQNVLKENIEGNPTEHIKMAEKLADTLLEQGARELLALD